ncbi:MAG: TIGR03067 domain-containing protein [Planctomycetes bacterium]|nr:TIGR03067 domain-containing protein [Planctomycetota bacterium]
MEGKWRIVAAEQGGRKVDSPDLVVFSGDQCILKNPGLPDLESTFTLDPSKNPKWIDVTGPKATGGVTWLGIYELKGDTLRAVFQGDKNGNRPTEFRTKKGSLEVMYTYKRVLP